ncbi:MAG: hypothetical protein IJT54_08435 [Candidatus Methanomethylophilaceae archaeon]|nr:hypothetical protein [Candidatus Methanomethylophilaceae archaeon]
MRNVKLVSLVMALLMAITVVPMISLSADAGDGGRTIEITSVPSRFSDDTVLSFAYGTYVTYYEGSDYDIGLSMTTSDSFTYTVVTNITSSVSISGTASTWLSVSDHTISGSPSAAGTYYLTITAAASTSGVSQSATQTIMFTVIDNIMMRTGDLFSYTVVTNISSTITASGTGSTWLSVSDHTISGSPTTAGTYYLDITATANTSGISQSASQRLTIQVCDRVSVTSAASNASVAVGAASGTVLKSFVEGTDWAGPSGSTVSCNMGSSGLFTWDSSTEKLKLSRAAITSDVGTYIVSWTVQYSPTGYKEADVQTHVVTISVYSDLVITSDSGFNSFVGNGSHTFAITTNHDSDSNASITKSATIPSAIQSYVSVSNGNLVYNFDNYTMSSGSSCDQYSITLIASGTLGDVTLSQATKTVTVKVYPVLEFTNLPTVANNVTIVSNTADNLDLVLTADIAGAEQVRIYWGDGTYTQVDPSIGISVGYSIRHCYMAEGEYLISIIAENDVGDMRANVLYDAFDEGFSDFNGNGPRNDFFDGHGNLWLGFLIVGITAILAYAVALRNEYVLFGGMTAVILSVIFYIVGVSI